MVCAVLGEWYQQEFFYFISLFLCHCLSRVAFLQRHIFYGHILKDCSACKHTHNIVYKQNTSKIQGRTLRVKRSCELTKSRRRVLHQENPGTYATSSTPRDIAVVAVVVFFFYPPFLWFLSLQLYCRHTQLLLLKGHRSHCKRSKLRWQYQNKDSTKIREQNGKNIK